jgi:hypothetical protein
MVLFADDVYVKKQAYPPAAGATLHQQTLKTALPECCVHDVPSIEQALVWRSLVTQVTQPAIAMGNLKQSDQALETKLRETWRGDKIWQLPSATFLAH